MRRCFCLCCFLVRRALSIAYLYFCGVVQFRFAPPFVSNANDASSRRRRRFRHMPRNLFSHVLDARGIWRGYSQIIFISFPGRDSWFGPTSTSASSAKARGCGFVERNIFLISKLAKPNTCHISMRVRATRLIFLCRVIENTIYSVCFACSVWQRVYVLLACHREKGRVEWSQYAVRVS
jgi:hypothetical protein